MWDVFCVLLMCIKNTRWLMLRYENKVQETIRYKNHLSSAELLTEQRLVSVL